MTDTYLSDESTVGGPSLEGFPPTLDSEADARSFLARLLLIGGLAGILAGLCVFQLGWWLSLVILAVWTVGSLAAGCVAAFLAKKHRAGVGYPAEPESWLRSFGLTYPIGGAVVGLVTVGLAAAVAAATAPENTSPSFTPAVLALIVAALAVTGMRWVAASAPRWLFYGVR